MTDNPPAVENADDAPPEMVVVKLTLGDMLVMVSRLTVITGNLVTAVSMITRGDTANASRIASDAGSKVDDMLDDLTFKLREALNQDAG